MGKFIWTKIRMSLIDSFNEEQLKALDTFRNNVYESKILNDIYKMLFTRGVFARFLAAAEFN